MRISDWSSDVCSSDLIRVDISGRDRDVLDALLAAGGRDVDGIFQEDDRIVVGIGDGTAPGPARGGGNGLWRRLVHQPVHLARFRDIPILAEIGRASCRERVCPYV